MQGHNKSFMANVPVYLRGAGHMLRVQSRFDEEGSPLCHIRPDALYGTVTFDLQPSAKGVCLAPWVDRDSKPWFGSPHPVKAYWLDYQQGHQHVCNLTHGRAKLLFTPMLDGCYIAVQQGRICHVAGKTSLGYDRTPAQMVQLAQQALGPGAFSVGFHSHLADAAQMTLVGVSTAAGLWSWYVQGHGLWGAPVDPGLEAVFGVNNLSHNIRAADRGQTVIELTDMTYG